MVQWLQAREDAGGVGVRSAVWVRAMGPAESGGC
jgi:hypothetical protein